MKRNGFRSRLLFSIGWLCIAWMTTPGFASKCALACQGENSVDRILLKSGAEVSGRIIEEKKVDGRNILVVELRSGGTVSLDRAKLVDKVRTYDALDANFERQLALAKPEPADYWKIFNWCEEQPSGKSRFKQERQFLLEKIIALNPNDKDARRKLGYRQENGQWVLENVWFNQHGYKKKEGRTWQSDMQSQFLARNASFDELKKQRKSDIDNWSRRYDKAKVTPDQARIEILNMADEATVSVLLDRLMEADKAKKDIPLRRVFMEVFSQVPNRDSIRALSYLAVQDKDPGIRDRALTMLKQTGIDRELAASMMAGHLSRDNDTYRERTAFVIGDLGAMGQFMSLVSALETKRKVVVDPDAGRMNLMNGPGGVGMQAPSTPTTVDRVVRSDASLNALRKLAKVDYGFDQEGWKNWYIRSHTLYDTQVRTDD